MANKPGRSDALRKRHRAIIARQRPACHICGQEIDYELRFPDPGCFVVDHVKPIAKGGADTIGNKKAAHHGCNSKKRARSVAPIIKRSRSLK